MEIDQVITFEGIEQIKRINLLFLEQFLPGLTFTEINNFKIPNGSSHTWHSSDRISMIPKTKQNKKRVWKKSVVIETISKWKLSYYSFASLKMIYGSPWNYYSSVTVKYYSIYSTVEYLTLLFRKSLCQVMVSGSSRSEIIH